MVSCPDLKDVDCTNFYNLFLELYLRWIVDQKNSEWTAVQIQELITNEKELRTKVPVDKYLPIRVMYLIILLGIEAEETSC